MLSDVLVPMPDLEAADPVGDYLAARQGGRSGRYEAVPDAVTRSPRMDSHATRKAAPGGMNW